MITLAQYDAAMTGYKALFQKAYRAAEPDPTWAKLASPVKSNARQEIHNWLLRGSGMGLWIGNKQRQQALASEFAVKNLPFEGTITFDRHDLEDDQTGGYDLLVQGLAEDARNFPTKLMMLLLANATATTMTLRGQSVPIAAWDGKALFASARTIGKDKNQTNIYSGTGTTYDKVIADFQKARVGMMKLKNGSGEALSRMPSIAVIPPTEALVNSFDTILANRAPLGTADIRQYLAGYIVNPEASGNDWMVFDVSRPVKAVMVQTREDAHMVTPAYMSEAEFERHEIVASAEARGAVVPADWTCAALVDNS